MATYDYIKKVLTDTDTDTVFDLREMNAVALVRSIMISNTDLEERRVWFLVKNPDDISAITGTILAGCFLDPYETLQLPDRLLAFGNSIVAYADVANKVSLVADIEIIKFPPE